MKFLILIMLFSQLSFAQVGSGLAVKAKDYNSSKFNIGDIKSSILSEAQFLAIHGDCWTLLRAKSIEGSDLAILTAGRLNNLPAAEGHFLRNAGGTAASLGSLQADSFIAHRHLQNDYNFSLNTYTNTQGTASRGSGTVVNDSGSSYVTRSPNTQN